MVFIESKVDFLEQKITSWPSSYPSQSECKCMHFSIILPNFEVDIFQ